MGGEGADHPAHALTARPSRPRRGDRGLAAGTRLTVAVVAVIGALMLAGFDAFFDAFHGLFFAGDSWRLPNPGTARSLYPDALWVLLGGTMVALVLAQAAALELVPRRRRR